MDSSGRVGRSAGILAPAVSLATVLCGAFAAPGYRWPTDPFSVVGGTSGGVALAFNAGLLLAGVLAVVFAVALWRRWRPALGVSYALGGVGLAGAGAFPVGSGLHEVAALFFATAWLPPVLAGVADWRSGARTRGTAAVLLGALAVGIWLPYDFGVARAQVGYGAAELVTFLAWGAWSAWSALRLGGESATDGAARPEVAT